MYSVSKLGHVSRRCLREDSLDIVFEVKDLRNQSQSGLEEGQTFVDFLNAIRVITHLEVHFWLLVLNGVRLTFADE